MSTAASAPLAAAEEQGPRVGAAAIRSADWLSLVQPATVRTRCTAVADNRSMHFKLDRGALPAMAQRVLQRWQAAGGPAATEPPPLWNADGQDREAELHAALAALPPAERAGAVVDVHVLHSVVQAALVPPAAWRFEDRGGVVDKLALPAARHGADDLLAMLNAASASGPVAANGKSDLPSEPESAGPGAAPSPAAPAATPAPEGPAARPATLGGRAGLAVAVLRAFLAGAFSSDRAQRLRVDSVALGQMDAAALRALLQSTPVNPMPGLDELALRLRALRQRPALLWPGWQPGTSAPQMLADVLAVAAPSCRGASVLGIALGDAFEHPWAGGQGAGAGWVPLHGAAQALVRRLANQSVLLGTGWQVADLGLLSAVPSLKLANAFIAAGVLRPRDERDLQRTWAADHGLVNEARAVAVHLAAELAHALGEASGQAGAADLQAAIEAEGAKEPGVGRLHLTPP
jgi:hypothetical protein